MRNWETSNIERRTPNESFGNGLGYRVWEMVGRVCFVRHSPLRGANDEQSRFIWGRYPGLRLLRSLTLGYYLSPFQGLEIGRPKISDLIQRRSL